MARTHNPFILKKFGNILELSVAPQQPLGSRGPHRSWHHSEAVLTNQQWLLLGCSGAGSSRILIWSWSSQDFSWGVHVDVPNIDRSCFGKANQALDSQSLFMDNQCNTDTRVSNSYINCQNLGKTFVETNCNVPRNHCFELGKVLLKTIISLAV